MYIGGVFANDPTIFVLGEIQFKFGEFNVNGSEHQIANQSFPLELQFLHYNPSVGSSVEKARGKTDGILALSIMFEVS